MNMERTEGLMSQTDLCRCCLSTSGSWDVTTTYITEAGIKEVYSDMLQECYGITLSYLSDWGPSHLVCGVCVGHLREASSFRKQVLHAEKQFLTYCSNKTDPMVIKTELEIDDSSPSCFDDSGGNGEDIAKLVYKENVVLHKIDATKKRKGHKTILKAKKRRKNTFVDDIDSDTPISELTKKTELKTSIIKDDDCKSTDLDGDSTKCMNEYSQAAVNQGPQHPQNGVKQVSERKRVMLTCDAVLRDTTACPFRHHKSWFQCFFCQQDFMEINLLRDHTLKTHNNIDDEIKNIKRYPRSLQIEISNLECRHCHLNLTDVDTMRRHFVDVHEKVIYNECIADYKVDSSPYSCHLCGLQFHVFRTLTTHLNEHYANYICDVCGKSFLNSKRLKVHKRTHESGHFPCTECGKILKTKTSKANHMESAHSKRVIKCQICFKPMKHYNHRIKHMSEVHNITHKFKCPICAREYNIKHYLATHIRQTHGHKNKKCQECEMAFITNHGLKKHMLKHSGVKPFTCSVCCKSYARSYTLREHMRAHDSDRRCLGPESTKLKGISKLTAESYIDNRNLRSNITIILKNSTIIPFKHINNGKYTCLYCDAAYLFFKELKYHVNEVHKDINEEDIIVCLKTPKDLIKADISEIKCKICYKEFDTVENLSKHLIEHKLLYYNTRWKPSHGILGFNLSFENLKCHVCGKEFRFFKNLSVHMNEHSSNFMCHVCGKKFVSDHRLQTHVILHRKTDIKCKHCAKSFRSVSARNYHIRKTHNNSKFKCTECPKLFSQYQHRLKHLIEVHRFKKPEFRCDVCSKEFASSGGLRAHMRYTHLKSKEYECEICGKVFVYKWIWRRHLDAHTGTKNYECKYCNKRFAKPYTLEVHVRIHLNDKRFVCSVCKAAFVQKCSLKNHIRVHHSDSGIDLNKL